MTYLFEFYFASDTINGNIHRWCLEKQIDTFNDVHGIYADIYSNGEYRKLEVVPVNNDLWEVYASDEIKTIEETGLKRLYPTKERALMIENPCRKVKVTLEDGFEFTDEINLPSRSLGDYFRTAGTYTHDGKAQKVKGYALIA